MLATLLFILYLASLVLVIWAVVDVARRPAGEMPSQRKTLWIIGMIVGWLVSGLIGGIVAVSYLTGPRRRLNTGGY